MFIKYFVLIAVLLSFEQLSANEAARGWYHVFPSTLEDDGQGQLCFRRRNVGQGSVDSSQVACSQIVYAYGAPEGIFTAQEMGQSNYERSTSSINFLLDQYRDLNLEPPVPENGFGISDYRNELNNHFRANVLPRLSKEQLLDQVLNSENSHYSCQMEKTRLIFRGDPNGGPVTPEIPLEQ
jgi:hypothetical protein